MQGAGTYLHKARWELEGRQCELTEPEFTKNYVLDHSIAGSAGRMVQPVVIALLLVIPFLIVYRRFARRAQHLPPGPPGLPLIGNVRDIPSPQEYPWLTYHKWCREYGGSSSPDILVLRLLLLTEVLRRHRNPAPKCTRHEHHRC